MTTKSLTPCARTAQELRAELKTAFPATTFAVKSKSYSGGSSIRVQWTDGPMAHLVEAIADRYTRCDFDGMQDLKTYRKGSTSGADFVFCERTPSEKVLEHVRKHFARIFGFETKDIPSGWGGTIEYRLSRLWCGLTGKFRIAIDSGRRGELATDFDMACACELLDWMRPKTA